MTPSLRVVPVTDLGRAILLERQNTPAPRLRGRRLWQRRLAMVLLACTTMLGVGSSTAQAWPWDIGDDIGAFVTYLCKPMDLPIPSTYKGLDQSWGLNEVQFSKRRGTIMPDMAGAGQAGVGIERARTAYGQNPIIIHPTYERYGFSGLRWTSFGASCASVGGWLGTSSYALKLLFVDFPVMITMAALNMALSPDLMTVISSILLSPVSGAMYQSFKPIMFFLITMGAIGIFFQVRGSLRGIANWFVWVVFIMGIYGAMATSPPRVLGAVNNLVASTGALMGTAIQQAQGGYAAPGQSAEQAVNEAVWRGIPYQTWLIGQVGPSQALKDAEDERAGKLGWGPAILNGNYIGSDSEGNADADGKKVVTAIAAWNARSYAPNGDSTKTDMWTNDNAVTGKAWAQIPALATVKWICNDTTTGTGEGNSSPESNRWLYGGSCDAAGAGTADLLPYFTGEAYNSRIIALTQGQIGALAVLASVGFASVYLLVQKTLFCWLMVVAPMFLAVGAMGTRTQRGIATRFGSHLGGNVLKQCAAVVMVLFTSHVATTVLTYSDVRLLPPSLRPLTMTVIFASMLLGLPLASKIMSGALAGDTTVVDKTARAPEKVAGAVAGTTAKVAVVAGAAALTGGSSTLGSALGAAGSKKFARGLVASGRAMGSGSKVGSVMKLAGHGMQMRDAFSAAAAAMAASKKAREAGIDSLLAGPDKDKYRDKDGNPSRKLAGEAYDKLRDKGGDSEKSEKVVKANLERMYAQYLEKTGVHHVDDPKNPVNVKAEATAKVDVKDGTVIATGNELAAKVSGKAGEQPSPADLAAASRKLYEGGHMDPDHDATRSLLWLQAAQKGGDAATIAKAMTEAERDVDFHGLPNLLTTLPTRYEVADTSQTMTDIYRNQGLKPGDMAGTVGPSAYDGGLMDPQHPATPLLMEAHRAQEAYRANANQANLDSFTAARIAAGSVIEDHGLPARVRIQQAEPVPTAVVNPLSYAEQLLDNSPKSLRRNLEVFRSEITASGATKPRDAGLTREEADLHPEVVLSEGYKYRTNNINPWYTTSADLINLNFAHAAGDEQGFEAARLAAVKGIREEGGGYPFNIAGPYRISDPSYDPTRILSVMPHLADDAPWQERATAALTMQRAYTQMPHDHEAAQAMGAYVTALGDPDTPLKDVRALGLHAASVIAPPPPPAPAPSPEPGLPEFNFAPQGPRAPEPAPPTPEPSPGLAEFDFAPRGPRAPEPAPPPPEFSDTEPAHDWAESVPAAQARRRSGRSATTAPRQDDAGAQDGQGWGRRLAEHLRSVGESGDQGQDAGDGEIAGMGDSEADSQSRADGPRRSVLFDNVREQIAKNRRAREEGEI